MKTRLFLIKSQSSLPKCFAFNLLWSSFKGGGIILLVCLRISRVFESDSARSQPIRLIILRTTKHFLLLLEGKTWCEYSSASRGAIYAWRGRLSHWFGRLDHICRQDYLLKLCGFPTLIGRVLVALIDIWDWIQIGSLAATLDRSYRRSVRFCNLYPRSAQLLLLLMVVGIVVSWRTILISYPGWRVRGIILGGFCKINDLKLLVSWGSFQHFWIIFVIFGHIWLFYVFFLNWNLLFLRTTLLVASHACRIHGLTEIEDCCEAILIGRCLLVNQNPTDTVLLDQTEIPLSILL